MRKAGMMECSGGGGGGVSGGGGGVSGGAGGCGDGGMGVSLFIAQCTEVPFICRRIPLSRR